MNDTGYDPCYLLSVADEPRPACHQTLLHIEANVCDWESNSMFNHGHLSSEYTVWKFVTNTFWHGVQSSEPFCVARAIKDHDRNMKHEKA